MLSLREKHEYEEEIAELKRKLKDMDTPSVKYTAAWLNTAIKNQITKDSRGEKASFLIKTGIEGGNTLSMGKIAKMCSLSVGTVFNLKYKIQKQQGLNNAKIKL